MGIFHKTLIDAEVALKQGKMNLVSKIIEKHLKAEFGLEKEMETTKRLLEEYKSRLYIAASHARNNKKKDCYYELCQARDSIETFEERIKNEAKSLE